MVVPVVQGELCCEALFEIGRFPPDTDDYGVSADGRRVLVKEPVEGSADPRNHVVTNWRSLLER